MADSATPDDELRPYIRSELAWAVAFAATDPFSLEEIGTRIANTAAQLRTGGVRTVPLRSAAFDAATAEQSLVMRAVVWEVVGNPFRPVQFFDDWRTDTAVSLAHQMYERREFSAMPILADALQDAGCDNDDVLKHCRDPNQVHLRGCWVVDLVLGNV